MPKTVQLFVFVFAFSLLAACSSVPPSPQPVDTEDRRILVIMTNHSEYPTRSDSTGLWLTELTHFTDVVEEAGYETVFASPKGGKVPLDERSLGWLYMDRSAREHLASATFRERLNNTLPISEVDPGQFAAIYFTGGHGVMWDFRDNDDLKNAAETIYEQGGVVSAVCHGIAGLINLEDKQGQPLIKDRKITGFSNQEEFFSGLKNEVPFLLQDELENKGADFKKSLIPFKSYALTDGRIVTGQNPSSAGTVAELVVSVLSPDE